MNRAGVCFSTVSGPGSSHPQTVEANRGGNMKVTDVAAEHLGKRVRVTPLGDAYVVEGILSAVTHVGSIDRLMSLGSGHVGTTLGRIASSITVAGIDLEGDDDTLTVEVL